jgi:phosphonoacetaldehyde hydrolase
MPASRVGGLLLAGARVLRVGGGDTSRPGLEEVPGVVPARGLPTRRVRLENGKGKIMSTYRWQRRYVGPIEAVIFDMAGTLMDFGSRAPAGVFVEVFRRRRVAIGTAEARGPMGAEKRRHIEMLLEMPAIAGRFREAHGRDWTQGDVDALYADFIPLQIESLPAFADMIPGAVALVRGSPRAAFGVGVNSGYSRDMLEVCLGEVPARASSGRAPSPPRT